MKRLNTLLLAAATLALAACNDPPPPAPEPPGPVMQGSQLRFPAGHPQLAQLGVAVAAPGKAVTVDLPARLVWNEERTQRIYAPFAGRVVRIAADVGQSVKRGTVLAQLASPDFGVAQADTAKAQADANLTQKTLQRQRELFDAGIVARKDLDLAEADAARSHAEIRRAEARTHLYGATSGKLFAAITWRACGHGTSSSSGCSGRIKNDPTWIVTANAARRATRPAPRARR